jgi:non-heme chloroperoxidase
VVVKKAKALWIAVMGLLCVPTLFAQDMTGDWQGTLEAGPRKLRMIAHFEQPGGAAIKATLYSIDENPDRGAGIPIDSVSVKDGSVQVAIAALRGNYQGTLAADGNSMTGNWTQGGATIPLTLTRATPATAFPHASPHAVQFVTVQEGVKLEVVDWGGEGKVLLLIAGLGNTAHVYDAFATKLIDKYHVIGITRRGFGASSKPATGYGADRLGDDVLAVMQQLKIDKPVLVGHSLGGEELSSLGSRFPDKVAGLVYLDAAYSYAFYSPGVEPFPALPATPTPDVPGAIMGGTQRYTKIPAPILAIYALPHAGAMPDAVAEQKAEAFAKAFEQGLPGARVLRIPNASHFVFRSHEADVLREMNAFISGLK